MKATYVKPLLVLTVICLVVSAALAFMNSITAPVIGSAADERTQEVMTAKIPDAAGFEPVNLDGIDGLPSSIVEIYRTTNSIGYILIAAVNGFSGDITVICAVDPDGRIMSCSTLSHTETRGIGTIIEQESFLGPFAGLDNSLDGIDTVTGATISTRAFIHAINDILIAFEMVKD
ncbi:MAG: FMN-binding protein [Oscillospiraceae bacterium]|nr:FMN-binding protein [Oscillospiraceae bacterium]